MKLKNLLLLPGILVAPSLLHADPMPNPVSGDFAVVDDLPSYPQNAVWFEGTFGEGILPLDLQEPGTRLFWYPAKAAFRGGRAVWDGPEFEGTFWSNQNIGTHSFSFGLDTQASGFASVSFGEWSSASGSHSFAAGSAFASGSYAVAFGESVASGPYSVAFGDENSHASGNASFASGSGYAGGWKAVALGDGYATGNYSFATGSATLAAGWTSFASGDSSNASGDTAFAHGLGASATNQVATAFGVWTDASGKASAVFGNRTAARGFSQFVVGQNNITQGNPDSLGPEDLLFIVGNGDGSPFDAPSNAFTVAMDGHARVHGALTVDGDLIVDGHVVSDFTLGNNLSVGGRVGINVSNPQASLAVHGSSVVFSGTTTGASVLAPQDQGAGTRMLWYPEKGAFRAGRVMGDQWDDQNIGLYSTSMGYNNKSTGTHATSFGQSSTASGGTSFSTGYLTFAGGDYSFVAGRGTQAQSMASFVIGSYNELLGGTHDSWISSEPLFIIGNGTAWNDRRNALTVLKNGNVGIGIYPQHRLDVDGDARISGNTTLQNHLIVGGHVGIGTLPDLAHILDVGGDIRWSGTLGGGSVPWARLTDVPSTFPPSVHAHPIVEVNGLQEALDSKLSASGGVLTGTLGIGTATPAEALDVTGRVRSSSGYIVGTNTVIDANRNATFESVTATGRLDVGGEIYQNGSEGRAKALLYFSRKINQGATPQNWKIATLPPSSSNTGEFVRVVFEGGRVDEKFKGEIGFSNRGIFRGNTISWSGFAPATHTSVRAFNQPNGSVDIYLTLTGETWSNGAVSVYANTWSSEDHSPTVYSLPENVGALPGGTLVFSTYTSVPPIYSNFIGRVGIGTTSPTTTFEVEGSAKITGDVTITGGTVTIAHIPQQGDISMGRFGAN